MADTKITALAAITTVDPAADVLPIVDISDTSMAASGTTKKVTSNQILGAGGTATLASATITGAATVTGAANLNGAVNLSTSGTPTVTLGSTSTYGLLQGGGTNASSIYLNGATRSGVPAYAFYAAAEHQFYNSTLSTQIATLNTTALTIANGNLVMGTSGKGIDFSATANSSGTMTSELLNDYEEGTWTPTAGDAASGGNQATTATAVGRYTKIGRLVTVHFELTDINTTGLTAGNSMNVRGLPFAASNATTQYGTITGAGITFTGFLTCGVYNGSAFPIYATSTGGALADIKVSGFASGTADIFGTLTYFV